MYLLSELAGVPVEGPRAKGDSTLGDGSLEQPFIVGSESLWADTQKNKEVRLKHTNYAFYSGALQQGRYSRQRSGVSWPRCPLCIWFSFLQCRAPWSLLPKTHKVPWNAPDFIIMFFDLSGVSASTRSMSLSLESKLTWKLTLAAPADSPKTVTLLGSPPNERMFLCTQAMAACWSHRP